ncbi:MAG: hypothetical protein SPJ83_01720 [Helicobacter sp.]|uniref:hypothetical protein n=1 Tax=Helicobacter sp. TaxID=218 RepID=UPI002A90BE2A|nr:hypothetical protein [Helicobacter sp.]MDY5821505.1 hypothetical protein [Helicobacter sp.]
MSDKNSQSEATLNGLSTQNLRIFPDGVPSAMMSKLQTEGVSTSPMIKPSQPQQTIAQQPNFNQQTLPSTPNNGAETKAKNK